MRTPGLRHKVTRQIRIAGVTDGKTEIKRPPLQTGRPQIPAPSTRKRKHTMHPYTFATMKTTRILLTILAAAALTACNGPVKPRFEQLTLDTLLNHPLGTCQVEYRFASIANADKSEALRIIEQSNTNYFFHLEDFEGPAEKGMDESLAQLAKELRIGDPDYTSVHDMEYDTSTESEGYVIDSLLCYSIYRSDYMGGAHGNYSTEYHLYSIASGFEYTAGDFFGEDKMEALGQLIRQKLYEKYDVSDDEGLSEQGFFPDTFFVTDNFKITPDGAVFIYNPYEIACYATGAVEVEIGRKELEAL